MVRNLQHNDDPFVPCRSNVEGLEAFLRRFSERDTCGRRPVHFEEAYASAWTSLICWALHLPTPTCRRHRSLSATFQSAAAGCFTSSGGEIDNVRDRGLLPEARFEGCANPPCAATEHLFMHRRARFCSRTGIFSENMRVVNRNLFFAFPRVHAPKCYEN